MRYILDANSMNEIDNNTINEYGIPALVLMEKAAMSVADVAADMLDSKGKVLILCGNGNNGADGVAVGRLLFQKNIDVTIYLTSMSRHTEELDIQLDIARKLGIGIISELKNLDYDLIIDAIFGIGLSRNIENDLAQLIDRVNESKAKVLAVDIPSGISATNASIMGTAIKADATVTFGYYKHGHLLYPGRAYTGELHLADIGFVKPSNSRLASFDYTLDETDLVNIPRRKNDSNKGSYGKVLVIAGSKGCCGAAILSAKAALKSGCGMVMVYTHKENASAIYSSFPECLVTTYEDEHDYTKLRNAINWADSVVIGPGLGSSQLSVSLVKFAFINIDKPMVIDADAINIYAQNKELTEHIKPNHIFTPHLKEMSRLISVETESIKKDIVDTARLFAIDRKCVCVLKDSLTIVAKNAQKVYINTVGNNGMATAGSGDVLTGVIAALCAQGMKPYEAGVYGVYIHALAGDCAASEYGAYSMTAMDIVDNLHKVFIKGSYYG